MREAASSREIVNMAGRMVDSPIDSMMGKPKHLKSIDLRDHALRWKYSRER